MDEIKKVVIEIGNLTEAQLVSLEDMLATWVSLGHLGSSRWTAFYADGDGNFRPEILIDGRKPEKTKLMSQKELWNTIKVKVAPNKQNGLTETVWHMESEVYMIDFDDVAWKLRDNE